MSFGKAFAFMMFIKELRKNSGETALIIWLNSKIFEIAQESKAKMFGNFF